MRLGTIEDVVARRSERISRGQLNIGCRRTVVAGRPAAVRWAGKASQNAGPARPASLSAASPRLVKRRNPPARHLNRCWAAADADSVLVPSPASVTVFWTRIGARGASHLRCGRAERILRPVIGSRASETPRNLMITIRHPRRPRPLARGWLFLPPRFPLCRVHGPRGCRPTLLPPLNNRSAQFKHPVATSAPLCWSGGPAGRLGNHAPTGISFVGRCTSFRPAPRASAMQVRRSATARPQMVSRALPSQCRCVLRWPPRRHAPYRRRCTTARQSSGCRGASRRRPRRVQATRPMHAPPLPVPQRSHSSEVMPVADLATKST